MNRTRKTLAAVLALTTIGSLTACALRPSPDEMYLYYLNGSVDSKTFSECIAPTAAGPAEWNNDYFALPTSLRTWNIRADGAGDTKEPIRSSSKPVGNQPGPEVAVYVSAEFYLNTNCDGGKTSPVVRFWEQTGRRYGVSDNYGQFSQDGWNRMLLNTLVPAEEKAIREVTRSYTADELDANTNGVWKTMETTLGATFLTELKAKTGGDYFCGPGYDRAKPACPPVRISITDVNFADQGIADARARVFKAEQDAKAALVAAQSQVDVSAKLASAAKDPKYLELKRMETWLAGIQACAQNPNCTTFVGDPGSVAVATK